MNSDLCAPTFTSGIQHLEYYPILEELVVRMPSFLIPDFAHTKLSSVTHAFPLSFLVIVKFLKSPFSNHPNSLQDVSSITAKYYHWFNACLVCFPPTHDYVINGSFYIKIG
jgi:hypothetical protein